MIRAEREMGMAGVAMLDEDVERAIDTLVRSGRYTSRSEVVRDALHLMEEQERGLVDLEAALDKGLDDVAVGRVKPATDVLDRLEAKYLSMAEHR